MRNRWLRRGAEVVLAVGVAAAAVALPARAVNDDLKIFSGFLNLDGGTSVGTGGDGSLVLLSSSFSFFPEPEDPITDSDPPYAFPNQDIFSWAPGPDEVQQFTATGNVENEAADDLLYETFNDQAAVFTRTGDDRNPAATRIVAAAYRTNADPRGASSGPSLVNETDLSGEFGALGEFGRTIVFWDSERKEFIPLVTVAHFHQSFSPSVAVRTRVTNRGSRAADNLRTLAISDAWVAFAGSANNSQDNYDGNDEIHLWTRSQYLESIASPGFVHNQGLVQVTHTVGGDCWAPAVSPRGDVAFLSDANITGGNADGSTELFLYRRRTGETRQLTSISPARTIGAPSWGDNGRRIVFASTANFGGGNLDATSEIFSWRNGKIRQITKGTTGSSDAPSADPFGKSIAFRTDADLPGLEYAGGVPIPEIVATPGRGRRYLQVTMTEDGGTNEAPIVTRNRNGRVQATWVSTSNLDGRNSNNTRRIYRARIR